MNKLIILTLIIAGALGCAREDDAAVTEVAKKQAEGIVDEENKNYARRVKAMEADLTLRHQYFSALRGVYEGVATTVGREKVVEYSFRLTVTPSLPPYPPSDRVRSIEELEYELNNLHLIIETLETHGNIVYGCIFDRVRPDMNFGTLQLASEPCVKSFSLYLAAQGVESGLTPREIAELIYKGDMSSVDVISGYGNSRVSGLRQQIHSVRLAQ